jgi:hypothetical protein
MISAITCGSVESKSTRRSGLEYRSFVDANALARSFTSPFSTRTDEPQRRLLSELSPKCLLETGG